MLSRLIPALGLFLFCLPYAALAVEAATAAENVADGSSSTDAGSAAGPDTSGVACSWQVQGEHTVYTVQLPETQLPGKAQLQQALEAMAGECRADQETGVAAEPKVLSLSGRIELQADASYEADVILIAADTVLISNGFDLIIRAASELRIDGEPGIHAFQSGRENSGGPKRKPGSHGRNAGLVSITAPLVSGGKLHINNHGEDGVAGLPGRDGEPGSRGAPGRPGVDRGIKGCAGKKEPGRGGSGENGKRGGRGGDAGDGGTVSLQLDQREFTGSYDRIVIQQSRSNPYTGELYRCEGSCPGAAGPGGAGGQGGKGGLGGSSIGGKWPCIGGGMGKPGKEGKAGKAGRSGKAGDAGSILIL